MIAPVPVPITKKAAAAAAVLGGLMAGLVSAGCSPAGPRAVLRGERLLREGRPVEAVAVLERGLAELPREARAWNLLGLARHASGQFEGAAQAYRQALVLDRSWVGFLSLFSGPVFGTLSDKLGRKAGLIIVFFLQMLSYLLVAGNLPGVFLYLSIFFYGIVAWSIPSIMAAAVGDYVGARMAGRAFGFITFIFGFGQIIGPAVAGVLAEQTGSFSSSFYMAAVLAGVAILLTSFLKSPVIAGRS